jgi:hypothetical protein
MYLPTKIKVIFLKLFCHPEYSGAISKYSSEPLERKFVNKFCGPPPPPAAGKQFGGPRDPIRYLILDV